MDGPRTVLGRFRLERELGRRPGTVTWLASDGSGGAAAVVREFRLSEAPAAESVATFAERARVLAGLSVPGIPSFLAFRCEGEGADTVCRLAREHVPGTSLAARVAAGRRAAEEKVVSWLDRAAAILAPLHRREPPLVHGGLRPANLILGDDGALHLVDFDFLGLAHSADAPLGFRLPWLASPYDPPEAGEGRLTPASDIWSLGATAAALLAGSDPGSSPDGSAALALVGGAGASPRLARLLRSMIDPDPRRRPRDAGALRAELAALRRGRGRRRRLLPRLALAVAAVALLRVGVAVLRDRGEETAPRRPAVPARVAAVRARAPAAPPRLAAGRPAYAPGEPITIRYDGLPGGDGDWITLVPAGSPDDSYRQWFWTGSAGRGSRTFDGQGAGDYEVRVYHDWPGGGYVVRGRLPLVVAAPAAAVGGAIVEGALLFGDRPVTAATGLAPRFWFRNEGTGKVQEASATYAGGRYRVAGLPEGTIGMSVRFDLEPDNPPVYPGDLDAWTTLRVPAAGNLEHDVHLRKIIRLRAPIDNNALTPGGDEECGRGQILRSPVTFRWDGLGEGVEYSVRITRMDCRRNYNGAGTAFETVTRDTLVTAPLPPSPDGECYGFHLAAMRGAAPVGMFTTHGDRYLAWDYRFAVRD